jgi:putative transposase
MSRQPRNLKAGYCFHVTVRCNNREFRLIRDECREVLLYAIQKCQEKYGFTLYALCITSNHVHYLLEPVQPDDLPMVMHWLNWYTAMCFNRMLFAKRRDSATAPGTFGKNAITAPDFPAAIHAEP